MISCRQQSCQAAFFVARVLQFSCSKVDQRRLPSCLGQDVWADTMSFHPLHSSHGKDSCAPAPNAMTAYVYPSTSQKNPFRDIQGRRLHVYVTTRNTCRYGNVCRAAYVCADLLLTCRMRVGIWGLGRWRGGRVHELFYTHVAGRGVDRGKGRYSSTLLNMVSKFTHGTIAIFEGS